MLIYMCYWADKQLLVTNVVATLSLYADSWQTTQGMGSTYEVASPFNCIYLCPD